MPNQLFRRKAVQAHDEDTGLKRVLGPVHLTLFGLGALIGTGIFVLTGTAAAGGASHVGAGPALIVSMVLTSITCGFAALCYAELASMIPISGSAYTYAYTAFGELVAWIIGWDLILEYGVGNIAVAIGWSGYLKGLLAGMGLEFPGWLWIDPMTASSAVADPSRFSPEVVALARDAFATAPNLGFPLIFNFPAILIVLVITLLLVVGIRESARANAAMVAVKLAMVLLFVVVGVWHIEPANWTPFAPNGWNGILTGAALMFFAYIGFDAVSTMAEETRNPQKNLPIGIIASLVICTLLYVVVTAVLTGMAPLSLLATAEPVAAALRAVGQDRVAALISAGAIVSMASVLLVFQYGQTRIFFVMSRDGLLPRAFSRVHPRYRTPTLSTVLTGLAVALPAGFIDISAAAELTNIGTLFAFILVSGGVWLLRVKHPEIPRAFKVPFLPVVSLGAIATCLLLMSGLPLVTWIRFGIWLVVGLVLYFLYGWRHSRLRDENNGESHTAHQPQAARTSV